MAVFQSERNLVMIHEKSRKRKIQRVGFRSGELRRESEEQRTEERRTIGVHEY